ncbi:HAD family acid phosphatase [Sphingomonas sp.]|uniref:HAD family acid phosphatase n=1 Tax=Sphingomonas sp. TaxID=28214 RepID=UPI003564D3D2
MTVLAEAASTSRRGIPVALAVALAGCATVPRGAPTPPVASVPPAMQYLYGSGEAAAQAAQAWRGLVSFVAQQVAAPPTDSAVLAADATLADPKWVPCGTKPKAAVFDVDETVLLNLGFEANDALHPAPYSAKLWDAWERTGGSKVAAQPGAITALAALRKLGVTVIFNTNRAAANADATRMTIEGAGLGPALHGETLYLSGDDAAGSRKDGRRATIAARYCVLAMGGDQLGDFSDLFNSGLSPAARRAAVLDGRIAAKFGAGWFAFPNPVYGTALKGGFDDVFPADTRWTPPATGEK